MAFCDGENSILLPPARDFKRLLEGDKGPNTGGMGAYSPLPDVDDALLARIKTEIIDRMLQGMADRGVPFRGLIFAGLMLTKDGPSLLEFNARPGDPETQVQLPRICSDIVPYILATLEPGGLAKLPPLEISPMAAVATNLVSKGYPDDYEKGLPMTEIVEAGQHALLFHAGTNRTPEGLFSAGGRVMTSVGIGESIAVARHRSQIGAATVKLANKDFRKDIAAGV